MNKKELNLFLPAVALIVAISGFLVSCQLLMPAIAVNQAKISAYKTDINKAQEKLDSIGAADKSMVKISDLVSNLLIAVPDSVDAPNLITEIESIAAQNQVALSSISPPEDISLGLSVEENEAQTNSSGLIANLAISGPFQNTYNFISAIESSIRFSKITSLTITSSEEGMLGTSIAIEVYKRPSVTASIGTEANNE